MKTKSKKFKPVRLTRRMILAAVAQDTAKKFRKIHKKFQKYCL